MLAEELAAPAGGVVDAVDDALVSGLVSGLVSARGCGRVSGARAPGAGGGVVVDDVVSERCDGLGVVDAVSLLEPAQPTTAIVTTAAVSAAAMLVRVSNMSAPR